jgi:hypothetical protein
MIVLLTVQTLVVVHGAQSSCSPCVATIRRTALISDKKNLKFNIGVCPMSLARKDFDEWHSKIERRI